jgi:hypothetical protein
MTTDFAGLNGFVWFTGVVEDRKDPLKLGRVRVRIIGWHDFDENMIPTDSLPWAHILHTAVGPRTFTSIKEGEWVSGYFLDGVNAQEPVIMGVYSGIISQETLKVTRKNPEAPKPPAGERTDALGEPSLPPMAREKIEETGIDKSNNSLEHVCDITNELRRDTALARLKFSQIMNKVRTFINELIAKLGLDPSGEISKAISFAKKLLAKLKYYRDVLNEILDINEVLVEYARRVRAMIDYILSLPAKLANLLANCLSNFLGAISTVFSELLKVPGLENANSNSEIGELFKTIGDVVEAGQQTADAAFKVIAIPATLTAAVAAPASQEEVDKAGQAITTFISDAFPSKEQVAIANTYTSKNTRQP